MVWLPASGLLQELDPLSEPSQVVERLLWLGRYGLCEQLEAEAARLRGSSIWSLPLALGLSVAWLLAADGRSADRAFLEADRLDPALALVPDPWGLWAPAAPHDMPPEGLESELLAIYRRWRWLDPEALRLQWAERVAPDWRWALTPEGLDGLALLVRHHQALAEPLQPFLAQLVGEAEMAADPGQALPFWGYLCDLWPDWGYARLKAAELALSRGELERAGLWLEEAPEADRSSAWHWDLCARQAIAASRVPEALDHWGEAVRQALASGDPQAEGLAELFRQRRREARRGPALLTARAWLNSGRIDEARLLLVQLLQQDPQWQPLRNLHDQAVLASANGAGGPGPVVDPASADGVAAQLDHFAALLDRAAAQRGIPLPPPHPEADPNPEISSQLLERFASALSAAEVRLALTA
jgi:tetratricopeptide (TPR) repeat protein